MRKYLPPPHKFRLKTLDSTDTVDFTHFRRTVNRYCALCKTEKRGPFRRNKTLYAELIPFQIQLFMLQLYSTSGDSIYLDNTYFYCIP